MSSFTKSAQQWATFARSWYLIDARMQPPGKIATMCAIRLQGKHKPIYHALSDVGDHVVVMNSRHIAFSGNKWEQKMYSSHTQYPGGFKQVTATQLHSKDPKARGSVLLQDHQGGFQTETLVYYHRHTGSLLMQIVKLAVYGMLPRNLSRRTMMQRLHLFPEDDLPEDILLNLTEELPQPREIPRRLNEYSQEEREAFPTLWTPPEDYRMK
uniref:Large ribosomal subunit protein uL13m n=1 Tax=Oncorhynchus tshawytscha TaxID=74940 RepID=A0A8C8CKY0_ONCTS